MWKKLKSKIVYENKWIKVIEDDVINPGGQKSTYTYLSTKADSVFIVPIDPKGNIVFVKVHRYITGEISLEIPGGNSEGENPLLAAKRELLEETGMVSSKWQKAGAFIALNGVVGEKTHVFIAKDVLETKENKMSEEGIVGIERFSFEKVNKMILENKITDSQTIVSIFKAKLKLKI